MTSGSSSDIQAATGLARNMVTRWGYSDNLGLVAYGDNQEEIFLGHSVARTNNISSTTAKLIEDEVKRFVNEGYETAKRVLTERAEDHKRLAEGLLEYETLSGDEIAIILRGEKLDRPDDTPAAPSAPTPALPVTDDDGQPAPHPSGWGGAQPQGA